MPKGSPVEAFNPSDLTSSSHLPYAVALNALAFYATVLCTLVLRTVVGKAEIQYTQCRDGFKGTLIY